MQRYVAAQGWMLGRADLSIVKFSSSLVVLDTILRTKKAVAENRPEACEIRFESLR